MNKFPLTYENFITEEENEILLKTASNSKLYEECDIASPSGIPRWRKRILYLSWLKFQGEYQTYATVKNVFKRIHEFLNNIEGTELHIENAQFSRWITDDKLDPPHADNIEQDGITPNSSPWRSHGIVLYLNSDFEGGELFYKHHELMIKPKPRMLCVHRADLIDTHGVKQVTAGNRYTVISFCSYEGRNGYE